MNSIHRKGRGILYKILLIKIVVIMVLLSGCLPFESESELHNYDSPTKSMKHSERQEKAQPEDNLHWEKDQFIWNYINKETDQWIQSYGEPSRKDQSAYGYEWWIYDKQEQYVQIAVKENQIVSIYTPSKQLNIQPLQIGQKRAEIEEQVTLLKEIEFDHLKFQLNDEDFQKRPIIRLSEGVFAQLYMDTFTDELSGIRLINKEVFELLRPYELYYYGELNEPPVASEDERLAIEKGIENQIWDITNVIRNVHDKQELAWDELSHQAAKAHSQDMHEQNYFSHFRPNGDGLKERLAEANANYLSAGENIAANYVDGPDVVHGWLNSEGHRDALLHDTYTHIGVGVYAKYYTQNFLQKLE